MGLFDKFLGKVEKPITTYADFWSWFSASGRCCHRTTSRIAYRLLTLATILLGRI